MSIASTSRTIHFSTTSGTYTTMIMSPSGDLYQDYIGTTGNVTGVTPDFSKTQPLLYFICTSSRSTEGLATPDSMKYYFGGTEITFGSDNISTGTFAGLFKRIYPSTGQPYYGLQILDNIAAAAGYASVAVKMVATLSYGTTSSQEIEHSYTIPIAQYTGTSYRVTIAAGDSKNFILTSKGDSCILKALAYQSSALLSSGLTYQWQKMADGAWADISGATSQTLTVSTDDVNVYGNYRVKVSLSGTLIGTDTQGVMDASDPYDVLPNPDPADETINETGTDKTQVTYTPKVVKRGTTTTAVDTTFYFTVLDAAGVYLNTDYGTAQASFSVTRAMCAQAGGDVTLLIESKD